MNKSELKRTQRSNSRKKERKQSSGSHKRSQEERPRSPKIKVVQSQKALIQGNAKQANMNQVDLVPQRDLSKKVPETGRYGSDWQMDGPDSFLNQKFKTNLNSSKMNSSKNSLFQTKAAQFVSQSYQTQSILPILNHSINQHSSVNEESQEESLQSSLANRVKQDQYATRNMALDCQLTTSQNDKSEGQQMFTRVYVMGETKHGQLGFMLDENTDSVIKTPKLCNYNVLVKQIACGEAHTHILSQEGFVYSMGINHYGVLGLSVSEMQLSCVTEPQLITTLSAITQIATGRAHTLALSANRTIYAWGRQDNGAISVRIAENHVPAVLDFNLTAKKGNKLAQIVKVSAGLEHSMFLTNSGDVYACGEGEHGQLGLGYCSLTEYRPLRVRFKDLHELDEIIDVACGAYHTLFVTKHHSVYSTGLNNLGQLGLSTDDPKMFVPQPITDLNGRFITKVGAGESSFALNDQGEIFVWGYYNQQVFKKPFIPSSIQAHVKEVSQSFYGVTSVVDQDNRLWVWDSKSQNSLDILDLQTYPQLLRPMRNKHVIRTFCGRGLFFALGEDVNPGHSTPQAIVTMEQNQVSINTTAQFSKQRNSKVTQKLPDLSLSEIQKKSESPKPKMKRPLSRNSTHSQSRSKSRKMKITQQKSASAVRKTTPDIKKIETRILKNTVSKSVSRSKSRGISREGNKNFYVHRENSKNNEKSRDHSKSREIKRLPVKKDSFENKSYSLSQAFKIINKAQKKSKPDDPIHKLIAKKFNGLLKRLDQDLKNLDVKMNNTDRKIDKKIKPKVASADTSPVVNKRDTSKPKRRKSTRSGKKRSHSRDSTNSKSQKKQKSVKSVLKHASTQLLDNNMTVDPRHSYGVFSPVFCNKPVETATSPTRQIVSDIKTKESKASEQDAESAAYIKKSVQPLSDEQYQHQKAALEQFQEYAKSTMQQLYVKIDALREENFGLKRELDQAKRNQESVKGELTLVKEQSATQLLTKGTIESKLRVLQIENETLKLQRADEERKIAMLEDRLQKLQLSKTKEDEYLAQLGRSCENLRKERMHVKDLQNEVQSLTKSLQIVEATLNQVKYDKVRCETEIRRLEEICKADLRPPIFEKQCSVPTVTSQFTDQNNPLSGRDQGYEFQQNEKHKMTDYKASELLSAQDKSRQNSPLEVIKASSRKSERSDLSRHQLYEKVNKKLTSDKPKPQGRNLLLAEQVFKRSQEASEEHSMRSRSNSKSQKFKNQIRDITNEINKGDRNQTQFKIPSVADRRSPFLAEPIYDTKESRETGRFVDSQQLVVAQRNQANRGQRSRSPGQGSPLRIPKEDASRHTQLRDRNFVANVQLNDNKIQDPAQNSLNRFMYIHKGTGDTKQDLSKDQKYGAFPTNLDEFGYRNQNQSYNRDLADEVPSDESKRDLKELKKRAIQSVDNDSRIVSRKSSQNDLTFKTSTAIELHDNRSKQEDFKHYAPSMRYLDNSPESRRTIQKLNGLEKENVKPEDRSAKQDQYNQMLLNNLERLADKKMTRENVYDRATSRKSLDKFVSNFEIQQSPRSASRSSNGKVGSSIGHYNAVANTQNQPTRKQIVALMDHSKLNQSLEPPVQRSRSGQGSQEPRLCQSQSNQLHIRKANKSHASDDTSSNSFLAKRVALQNRLKNL